MKEYIDYINAISMFDELVRNMDIIENYPSLISELEKDNNISYIRTSLTAIFLAHKKEKIVKKEGCLQHSSKIADEKLILAFDKIFPKKNNKYCIDWYEEENPSNIIALFRNKFEHSDYYIDLDNKNIIFNKDGKDLPVSIDDLNLLITLSTMGLLKYEKTKEMKRCTLISNKVYKDNETMKNRKDVENRLIFSNLAIYKLKNNKNNIIDERIQETFDLLLQVQKDFYNNNISLIKKIVIFNTLNIIDNNIDSLDMLYDLLKKLLYENYNNDMPSIYVNKKIFNSFKTKINSVCYEDLVECFKKVISNYDITLDIEHPKIKKGNTIEKVINMLDESFYNEESLYTQIKVLSTNVINVMEPNYTAKDYLSGIILGLHLCSSLEDKDNRIDENFYNNNKIELNVASSLARFYTTYIYPSDIYNIDRELDYSKLNLDFINPKKNVIDSNLYLQTYGKYKYSFNKLKNCLIELEKCNKDLNKSKSKNNLIGIKYQENKLKLINEKYLNLKNELLVTKQEYNKVHDDYCVNNKYYENRAIIEGIRNSICHGNVKIIRSVSNNVDDSIIHFENIYEDDLYFELDITISDFRKIFSNENVNVLNEFYSNTKKLIK